MSERPLSAARGALTWRIALLTLSLATATLAQDERLDLARRLAAAGNHAQAVPQFVQALEKRPSDPLVWTELAESRAASGQIKAAIGDFSKAIRLDPSSVRAQKGLALAVEKVGNPERAMIEWRRLSQIGQEADQKLAEEHLGALLAKEGISPPPSGTGKGTAAAKPSTKPLVGPSPRTAASGHASADLKKVIELWKAGKRDPALEALREVIRKAPSPEAYYYGGVLRFEGRDWEKAEFNLKKAQASKEFAPQAWYWMGRMAEERKRPKDAAAAFKKSLELNANHEYAADAKARLEQKKTEAAPTSEHGAAHEPTGQGGHGDEHSDVVHEPAPPSVSDSIRDMYSWIPPQVRIPAGDASPAGKLLTQASNQQARGENDVALSTIEQIRLKYPEGPASELTSLARAITYLGMGLPTNVQADANDFLQAHPTHAQAPLAKFVKGLAHLRAGNADSAIALLSALKGGKDAPWKESDRQSALGQALRLTRKYSDAAAALRLAFQAETDTRLRRNLALRSVRENQSAKTPAQALPLVSEARKGCDKSPACLYLAVSQADLSWSANRTGDALDLYQNMIRDWPDSKETPWARYQMGNAQQRLGKPEDAKASWKTLIEKHPESYWANQAKLRLEDALWRGRYKEKK